MIVYVVCFGKRFEGQSPIRVFLDHDKAREFCISQEHHFESWRELHPDYWMSGCDVIRIQAFRINK